MRLVAPALCISNQSPGILLNQLGIMSRGPKHATKAHMSVDIVCLVFHYFLAGYACTLQTYRQTFTSLCLVQLRIMCKAHWCLPKCGRGFAEIETSLMVGFAYTLA